MDLSICSGLLGANIINRHGIDHGVVSCTPCLERQRWISHTALLAHGCFFSVVHVCAGWRGDTASGLSAASGGAALVQGGAPGAQ